jgi:hypothetical protein
MVRTDGGAWMDYNNPELVFGLGDSMLPAYLMEPAQTARILKAKLPGEWWQIENRQGLWIVYRLDKNKRVRAAYGEADKDFGEAVARCAAGVV